MNNHNRFINYKFRVEVNSSKSWYGGFLCIIFCAFLSASVFLPIAQAQDGNQDFPLHKAIRQSDVPEVNRLLSAMGAEAVLQADDFGMLALHYASSTANLEIASILIERYGANPNTMPGGDYGWILRGRTPLHLAVASGNVKLVDLLLSKEANVFAGDKNGTLPLHLAIQYGRLRIANSLISMMGKNVHRTDKNKTTPLHLAAQYGRALLASNLIKKNADIEARNNYGLTPLHYASLGGHEEVVELLLGSDADVNATNTSGMTPLFLAARDGHGSIIDLLVAEKLIKLEARDNEEMTPLLIAVANGHGSVIKRFLQIGVDPHAKNKMGMLPLHHAAKVDDNSILNPLLKVAIGDVNKRDSLGNTPLHYAAQEGRKENVERLLSAGADKDLKNGENKTAQDIAKDLGHDQVLLLLR